MTPEVDINYLAVAVAVIVQFALGALWYSPVLFSKPWLKAMGKTAEEIKEESKEQNMMARYGLTLLTAVISVYVLSHIVDYAKASTVATGLQAGFWVWLGFVATSNLASVLFESRPKGLYFINVGYQLVGLLIAGGILAVWT